MRLAVVQQALKHNARIKALFWDYSSLYQHGKSEKRSELEEAGFKRAIQECAIRDERWGRRKGGDESAQRRAQREKGEDQTSQGGVGILRAVAWSSMDDNLFTARSFAKRSRPRHRKST